MKQKWFRALLRRRVLVGLVLLVQIALIVYSLLSSSMTSVVITQTLSFISLVVCLYIVSKNDNGAYKLTWVFMILLFPVFGGLFYLIFNFQTTTGRFAKKMAMLEAKVRPLAVRYGNVRDKAIAAVPEQASQVRYLQDFAGFPIYADNQTTYFASGEDKWMRLLEELKTAQSYIFLEYFIVQEGTMWNAILDILKEKAAAGVKVRLLYDDFGCFLLLPKDYPKQLAKYNIECRVFNPFRPFLTTKQNNRDHRKIAVIDGKTAFTGGINLADEYINAVEKYGHWKDTAVMVKGQAAWSFTLMFLQMWELCGSINEEYEQYAPTPSGLPCGEDFVQPYADSPLDTENVGEHVYLHLIHHATRYVYINTPYLIIDDSMMSALCLAAKSGVDVRIVTPHKWDKWAVHMTTRSYYRELIEAGVKIYEYSKGFIHSKVVVCDDIVAAVGTTNFDFRSLYLHFECGTLLYKTKTVLDIKEDYLNTLDVCQPVTLKDCKSNILLRIFQDCMRLFAPLM